ncbi:MAG: C25 family cysteine peptidase [Methanotrichaceae archaeon]
MRRLAVFLILSAIFIVQVDAQLERGVKSDSLEEIVLVGADDWHSSIAATPLAIWTDDNGTETRPFLILPRKVDAGNRIGWIDQADIERYGPVAVLHTMASANVSALVINGDGDLVKSLVKLAQKEGIKAYVTVTLEPPEISNPEVTDEDILAATDEEKAICLARDMFFQEIGLTETKRDTSHLDLRALQKIDLDSAQISVGPDGVIVSDRLCPVNPDARNELYSHVEELIEDYKVDGVVLYNFGFLGNDYCFCDVCKDEFYNDTGIDLARMGSNSYKLQRWKQWKEEQVLEIVRKVRNITIDLGPVDLGVAIGQPFDRSNGYNYAEISNLSDLVIVSPVPPPDLKVAAEMTETPVYVRLSDDYVEYTISTQNVEGSLNYIEYLVQDGAAGLAFEYDVVYTPLWSELEPPSLSARWLLDRLDGRTLGIGDVFWDCDSRIEANDSFKMAETISQKWKRSPGAVLIGNNYSSGLTAASIASYLNWPILFVGDDLPNSTESALCRLGATNVVTVGPVPDQVRKRLKDLNLTLIEGDQEFLIQEMKGRGEEISSVVLTNSHDLSLLAPKPKPKIDRAEIDDLLLDIDINPSEIPAESAGEIVRLKITLTNRGDKDLEDVNLTDMFLPAKSVIWSNPSVGEVSLTDPFTEKDPSPEYIFFDGVLLNWSIDQLRSHEYATLALEIEIYYPLDSGWTQPLDTGITVTYKDQEEKSVVTETADDGSIVNITYPSQVPAGIAEISWEVTKEPYVTYLNYYSPDGRSDSKVIENCCSGEECNASVLFTKPGTWAFNIETWKTKTKLEHLTDNFTVEVTSSASPINITAFSHTKIPKLSLTSAQIAAARKGLIVDVADDPQNVDPAKVEEDMYDLVEELKISPQYLIVVGGPGSLPFPSTGLKQQMRQYLHDDIYREFQIQLDDDDYQEVAAGRIIGLNIYDTSQLVARNLVYDKIEGDWRNRSLIISSPANPTIWPQSPIPIKIGEYLRAAGLDTENLREEYASYQRVSSEMNNGQNIVYFDYHGNERVWQLSLWALMDWALDVTQVKEWTLAPQTTIVTACSTSRLKGATLDLGNGVDMYIPMRLKDSIALAFLKAGSVNYVGPTAESWIFLSEDHSNNMYQALVFKNATVGESLMSANNLYVAKMKSAKDIDFEKIDEIYLPDWEYSVKDMLNQTANRFMLFGDPTFRPYIPKTPDLPYNTKTTNETDEIEFSITPVSEWGTDWIYWIVVDSIGGERMLNAPPALIGELMLPADAEEIVVKENGRVVWHGEDQIGSQKKVIWPVISPTLGESKTFSVEYKLVPGETQVIDVIVGWNPISLYLNPKDSSIDHLFKHKPYQSIFTISEDGWNYTFKESEISNVRDLEPGMGYIIDSAENFTVEIPGKPVDIPYRVNLHKGWNLIGVPINETVPIRNVTVSANYKRYNYTEAAKEGIVSAFLWNYDGDEWAHISLDESMVPGEAYMIETMDDCKLEFN